MLGNSNCNGSDLCFDLHSTEVIDTVVDVSRPTVYEIFRLELLLLFVTAKWVNIPVWVAGITL